MPIHSPRLRPHLAPACAPRRGPRPHRPRRAARADLRLPQPPHRPPGPILCGDRCQGRRLRPHRRHGTAAAEGAGDPELGAALRRKLAGRPVRAGAGDQRLRGAAGKALARLQAAAGAASARTGHPALGRSTALPSALAQAALEGDLAGKVHVLARDPKDGLAAALARLGRAFMTRELVRFPGVHEMRRNLLQGLILPATADSDRQTEKRKAH